MLRLELSDFQFHISSHRRTKKHKKLFYFLSFVAILIVELAYIDEE